ncbi:MAG: hypothetical protein ABSA13_18355 [Beijerinckiaceae bacterium]
MDQETVIQEAIVGAVTAGIHLMRSLGLIPQLTGDVTDRSQMLTQHFDSEYGLPADLDQNVDGGVEVRISRIYVYIFGCNGCANLGQRLKIKLYKIGSTTEFDLKTRLEQIGQEQYGACTLHGNELEMEKGFSRWVALPVTTSGPSTNPAITILTRAIQIDLPDNMTRQAFDAALQKALTPRALHLRKSARPKRLTNYSMGGASRVSESKELYEFAPNSKADGDMLLNAIEQILKDHQGKK